MFHSKFIVLSCFSCLLRLASADCGLILTPHDMSGDFDWPKYARDNGIRVLSTHIGPEDVVPFLKSDKGRKFLADCARYGVEVEHELHALNALLPRELFKTEPELFRMDAEGRRTPDANCCATSARARAIVASNAVAVARICRSTTGRYFYWLADNSQGCRCPRCREYPVADQAVLIENEIVRALRREIDPKATLAHLAYQVTFAAPTKVKPDAALFLEFAPIDRWIRWKGPKACYERFDPETGKHARALDDLLRVFPSETAQALEYWTDESLFCTWTTNRVVVPWNTARTERDAAFYRSRGIRRFRSFAVSVDDAYRAKFGPDSIGFLKEYARIFSMPELK